MSAIDPSQSDPKSFVFKECIVEEINIGDRIIRGDEIVDLEFPSKNFPAWRIQFDSGEGTKILITSGVPLIIEGIMVKKAELPEEEIPSEDE